MTFMLPSVNTGELSLADVLPSCLSALGVQGYSNSATLPSVNSAVVILVDGLGALNLSSARGHARFLADVLKVSPRARTVFPSTTASALVTLTTGSMPSDHGLLGYKIRDPHTGQVINQLTGLGALADLTTWAARSPLYGAVVEAGMQAHVVSHARFASTPLTSVIHEGASMVSANTLDDRFETARRLVEAPGQHLVVLYISELDEIAHKFGVDSPQWAQQLESLDAAVRSFLASLPSEVGVLLTADHGVIDIPPHKHLLFGDDDNLMADVASVGGEPRGLQLFLATGASPEQVASRWRESFGDYAWVVTRDEAIAQGLFGTLSPHVEQRLGEVLVIARKDIVFYDSRDITMSGRSMVGQHGGLSDAEMRIPFIRLGAFASK